MCLCLGRERPGTLVSIRDHLKLLSCLFSEFTKIHPRWRPSCCFTSLLTYCVLMTFSPKWKNLISEETSTQHTTSTEGLCYFKSCLICSCSPSCMKYGTQNAFSKYSLERNCIFCLHSRYIPKENEEFCPICVSKYSVYVIW